jgi:hypothetical protein
LGNIRTGKAFFVFSILKTKVAKPLPVATDALKVHNLSEHN